VAKIYILQRIKQMTKEVWDDWSIDVASKTGKTNINNTNYINNTNNINNNINYFTRCDEITSEEEVMETPAGASGIASRPGKPQLAALLPKGWRGLKLDLFNNGRGKNNQALLKLKLGIIKQDGTTQSLITFLGSPTEYVWRGWDPSEIGSVQWNLVDKTIKELEQTGIHFVASKFVLPNKAGKLDWVCCLIESESSWFIILLREGQKWDFELPKDSKLTEKQKQGNIVSSMFIGQPMSKFIDTRALGI
jgi:hypothetical protein